VLSIQPGECVGAFLSSKDKILTKCILRCQESRGDNYSCGVLQCVHIRLGSTKDGSLSNSENSKENIQWKISWMEDLIRMYIQRYCGSR
jgi:hypothetical protein